MRHGADRDIQIFISLNADIRYRGDRAYCSFDSDYIQVSVIEAFRDAESFYATQAHESAHWCLTR